MSTLLSIATVVRLFSRRNPTTDIHRRVLSLPPHYQSQILTFARYPQTQLVVPVRQSPRSVQERRLRGGFICPGRLARNSTQRTEIRSEREPNHNQHVNIHRKEENNRSQMFLRPLSFSWRTSTPSPGNEESIPKKQGHGSILVEQAE